MDTETLSKAAAIRYKMELFQKNENGTYDETKPLEIGSYLQNIVKDSKSDDTSGMVIKHISGRTICIGRYEAPVCAIYLYAIDRREI